MLTSPPICLPAWRGRPWGRGSGGCRWSADQPLGAQGRRWQLVDHGEETGLQGGPSPGAGGQAALHRLRHHRAQSVPELLSGAWRLIARRPVWGLRRAALRRPQALYSQHGCLVLLNPRQASGQLPGPEAGVGAGGLRDGSGATGSHGRPQVDWPSGPCVSGSLRGHLGGFQGRNGDDRPP